MRLETPACVAMHPKTRQWFVVDATIRDYDQVAGPLDSIVNRTPISVLAVNVITGMCALLALGLMVAGDARFWWPLIPVAPLVVLALVGWARQEKRAVRMAGELDRWFEGHDARPVMELGNRGVENIAKMIADIHLWRRVATEEDRWGGNDPNIGVREIAALTRAAHRFADSPTDDNLRNVGWAFEKAEKAHDKVFACFLFDVSSPAHLARLVRGRWFERSWEGPRELGWI